MADFYSRVPVFAISFLFALYPICPTCKRRSCGFFRHRNQHYGGSRITTSAGSCRTCLPQEGPTRILPVFRSLARAGSEGATHRVQAYSSSCFDGFRREPLHSWGESRAVFQRGTITRPPLIMRFSACLATLFFVRARLQSCRNRRGINAAFYPERSRRAAAGGEFARCDTDSLAPVRPHRRELIHSKVSPCAPKSRY